MTTPNTPSAPAEPNEKALTLLAKLVKHYRSGGRPYFGAIVEEAEALLAASPTAATPQASAKPVPEFVTVKGQATESSS